MNYRIFYYLNCMKLDIFLEVRLFVFATIVYGNVSLLNEEVEDDVFFYFIFTHLHGT